VRPDSVDSVDFAVDGGDGEKFPIRQSRTEYGGSPQEIRGEFCLLISRPQGMNMTRGVT
jgi:hypothetical protein